MSQAASGRARFRLDGRFVYVLIAVVAVVPFLPWVQGYFLGDDWMLYARNSGPSLPQPLRSISDASNSSQYRPLFELSLAGLWGLFGLQPLGHHLVNLILHALNAVLVAGLAEQLAGDRRVSLWAGLAFAVLGCHTEAVVWMTARHELIVSALALIGTISYVRFRDGHGLTWWAGGFGCYLISFGFKETALALPLFLLFYELMFQRTRARERPGAGQWLAPLMPFLAVGAVYTLYRLSVGGGYGVPFTLVGPPKNLVYYLLMETVALPASTRFLSRFPAVTWPVLTSLSVALAFGAWLARDKVLRSRTFWFGLLWMVVALAPVILIVAERTTYVSSAGWALVSGTVIVLAWERAGKSRTRLNRGLVVLLVAAFVGANLVTVAHRGYWWDRAADISEQLFDQVQDQLSSLPPDDETQLWFVNLPYTIEYAYAFGNRVLFAAWLVQRDLGTDAQVAVIQENVSAIAPYDHVKRLALDQAVESPIVAFYWQQGNIVQFSVP